MGEFTNRLDQGRYSDNLIVRKCDNELELKKNEEVLELIKKDIEQKRKIYSTYWKETQHIIREKPIP